MRAALRLLKSLDLYLLIVMAVMLLASVLPARGAAVPIFGGATDAAIVLLFFLHGVKLSREAVLAGLGNWRLHLMVFASTYILFPILGWTTAHGAAGFVSPEILSGVLYLSLLPSTIQTSIAMTALARGNVAAAVASASISNLIGIFLTPLLVGLLIHIEGQAPGISLDALQGVVVQLLLPFLAGHLLRPLIGGFVARHRRVLMPLDRASVLLVVYTAFSAAVVGGIWTRIDAVDLAAIFLISAAILGIVLSVNHLAARRAGLSVEDEIVLLFCGSKKSLVSGVPIAGAIFAQVGVIVLPLMIFHQLQLFACTYIASRYARRPETKEAASTAIA